MRTADLGCLALLVVYVLFQLLCVLGKRLALPQVPLGEQDYLMTLSSTAAFHCLFSMRRDCLSAFDSMQLAMCIVSSGGKAAEALQTMDMAPSML